MNGYDYASAFSKSVMFYVTISCCVLFVDHACVETISDLSCV